MVKKTEINELDIIELLHKIIYGMLPYVLHVTF